MTAEHSSARTPLEAPPADGSAVLDLREPSTSATTEPDAQLALFEGAAVPFATPIATAHIDLSQSEDLKGCYFLG